MAHASHKYVFREFQDNQAVAGQLWKDADGKECSVHVRSEMLIVDYIDFAQASGVLQNQACPECDCPTGQFHLPHKRWCLRTAELHGFRD